MKLLAKNGTRRDIKMIDLNNLEEIKKLDPENVYGSTELMLDQCSQIWEELKTIQFPPDYANIQNIVFSGMGGSALGAQVTYHLFKSDLSVPFYINNDYNLPRFADENTLVILSSYSGTTEETLNSAREAISRKCKVIGITTGGELLRILEENNLPYIKINPKNNPAGQPRLGTGYATFGAIAILSKIGVIKITNQDVTNAINFTRNSKDEIKQKAAELAKELQERIPVIFAADFLVGNAHVIRNQFNETAKTFSTYSPISELNHHLMEGLKNPKNKNLTILFLKSNLYSDIIKKRVELTKEVVSKNGVPYLEYETVGDSKLTQALSTLSFGGYLTLYLGLLYGQDPSVIPWVDYFKENLHK